jgi:hypothetical protein
MLTYMALIIPAGYAQVVMQYTSPNFDSGVAATVFGLGEPLGDDPASLTAAANAVSVAWIDNLRGLTDNNVTLASVEVNGPADSAIVAPGSLGVRSTQNVAPNIALLVKKLVAGRGRRRQGRMFLPGLIPVNDLTEGGVLLPTPYTTLQNAVSAFYDDIQTTLSVPMVILQNTQKIIDGSPVGTPPISPPPVVEALIVQQKVASQRRRLRR